MFAFELHLKGCYFFAIDTKNERFFRFLDSFLKINMLLVTLFSDLRRKIVILREGVELMFNTPAVGILSKPDIKYQKAMYLLVNYRKIANDFDVLVPEDAEYSAAESYVKQMDKFREKLKKVELPDTGFLKKSKLSEEKMRELYFDTLDFSYFSKEYKSSAEIIEIFKEKYGINLNPARLTKLKSEVVKFFSFVV